MNAYMNIQVRVYASKAEAAMARLRGEQKALVAETIAANRVAPLGTQHVRSLMKFGNQLQWTGRMLLYNFTLPIAAAGIAATKWAMDQEKAMVHVKKVYGDSTAATAYFRKNQQALQAVMAKHPKVTNAAQAATASFNDELKALDKTFTELSNKYGVAKSQIEEVAGAWAGAGVSGLELAKVVDTTMTAIVIGDMDAKKATTSLIQIQGQYNLSAKGLYKTLTELNSVENATGATMSDLIDSFARAAGVARSVGVSTRQLAALTAALVPAAGSAANAGNALKTIFSRLVAPTTDAAALLEKMGFHLDKLSWNSSTAVDRLKMLAKKFEEMPQAQKNVVSSFVASRWQLNKFDVLMRELTNDNGYYQKALNATTNQQQEFKTAQQELNAVLESNPQKLKRMWVMLQNAMVKIIQPLIPFIVYLAQQIANMAQAFANLNPFVSKLILLFLVFLALIGPVTRYVGALTSLYAVLAATSLKLGQALGLVTREMVLANGATVVAKRGLLQFIAALTIRPVMMFGTLVMSVFTGLAAFIFRVPWIASFKSFYATLALTAGATKAWAVSQLIGIRLFWSKWLLLWRAAQLATASNFAAMWLIIKGIAVRGWATLVATTSLGYFVELFARIKQVVTATWAAMWARNVAVTAIGTGTTTAIATVGAAEQVGIFSKMRTLVFGVFASMWAGIVAISKFGVSGLFMAAKNGFMAIIRLVPMVAEGVGTVVGAIFTPVGALIAAVVAAVVGVLYAFRNQIGQFFHSVLGVSKSGTDAVTGVFDSMGKGIMNVFHMLPQGVQQSMLAVVKIIRAAALAVYDWFSYINPFAHHSPSLVENVTKGMRTVITQFSTLSQIRKYTSAAYADIAKFGKLTASIGVSAANLQAKQDRTSIRKAGGGGAALAEYNKLFNIVKKLTPVLDTLNQKLQAQQQVVAKWQDKVDKANAALDVQQKKLDALTNVVNKYQDKLSAAQQSLSDYANAPLKGMAAMNEQIWQNSYAQTKLNYEMAQMEQTTGTLDQIKSKLDAINGAQELLRGEQTDLRAAGAGGDILKQYDQQIKSLDQQKNKYQQTADVLGSMQAQLDALQQEANRLDLVKAMKFDELQHKIELAADTTKELSFDDIIAGITKAKGDIATYTAKLDDATKKQQQQQAVVDKLTALRDKLQSQLDKENAKLDQIQKKYDAINQTIQDINTALSDVVSKSDSLNQAHSKAKGAKKGGSIPASVQAFNNAAGGDFPEPGGKGIKLRKDWASQAGQIDKFTQQIADQTSSMFAGLNPFTPLKKKAGEFWGWLKGKFAGIGSWFGKIFDHIHLGGGGGFSKVLKSFESIGLFITNVIRDLMKIVKLAWDLLGPEIKKIGKGIVKGLKSIWDQVGPELVKFWPVLKQVGKAFKNLWTVLKPIVMLIAGAILGILKVILSAIGEAIGPLLSHIGGVLKGVVKIIRGVIEIVAAIFTGDWKMLWQGVVDVVVGTFGAIWNVIAGAGQLIWDVVKGIVKGVWNFFHWLWDELVGHSIVPDMVNAIIFTFKLLIVVPKWIWKHVLKPVFDFFKDVWEKYIRPSISKWWSGIQNVWSGLKTAGRWFWTNVLQPVWNRVSDVWYKYIKPFLGRMWAGFQAEWAGLKTAGKWFKTNVMDPIFNTIKNVWNAIKGWLGDNKDLLLKPMKTIVDSMINAVNFIIKGLNKVSDILPGIDWKIDLIPKFADGGAMPGRKANRGFKTTGARAIVGEGKPNYPEFVIPTDPTHRRRAVSLLAMAASKVGVMPGGDRGDVKRLTNSQQMMQGVPAFGIGGWISSAWGGVKDMGKGLIDQVKKLGKHAIGAVMNPILDSSESTIKGLGWPPIEAPPLSVIEKVRGWVTGSDANLANYVTAAQQDSRIKGKAGKALKYARSMVGTPYLLGGFGPGGIDCSGFMSAIANVYQGKAPYVQRGTTFSFPWPGWKLGENPKGFTVGSTPLYPGSNYGHMAGTLNGVNVESRGGRGVIVGPGARGFDDPGFRQIYSLADGAIVKARRGGVLARIGEGNYDEAVTPLPKNWKKDGTGGEKHYHFYGDLSFPNITSPDDAQTFLDNLESLAKD